MANQHVMPLEDIWIIRSENPGDTLEAFSSKSEAIIYAKELAKRGNSELIVHKFDGSIDHKNSYIKHPF